MVVGLLTAQVIASPPFVSWAVVGIGAVALIGFRARVERFLALGDRFLYSFVASVLLGWALYTLGGALAAFGEPFDLVPWVLSLLAATVGILLMRVRYYVSGAVALASAALTILLIVTAGTLSGKGPG